MLRASDVRHLLDDRHDPWQSAASLADRSAEDVYSVSTQRFGAVAVTRDLPVPPLGRPGSDQAPAGDGPDAVHIGFLPDAAAARAAGALLASLAPTVPRVVETALVDPEGVDRVDAETLAEIKRSVLLGASLLVATMADARRLTGLPGDDRSTDADQVALLLLTIGVEAVLIHVVDGPGGRCTDVVMGDVLEGGSLRLPCACGETGRKRSGVTLALAEGGSCHAGDGRRPPLISDGTTYTT